MNPKPAAKDLEDKKAQEDADLKQKQKKKQAEEEVEMMEVKKSAEGKAVPPPSQRPQWTQPEDVYGHVVGLVGKIDQANFLKNLEQMVKDGAVKGFKTTDNGYEAHLNNNERVEFDFKSSPSFIRIHGDSLESYRTAAKMAKAGGSTAIDLQYLDQKNTEGLYKAYSSGKEEGLNVVGISDQLQQQFAERFESEKSEKTVTIKGS